MRARWRLAWTSCSTISPGHSWPCRPSVPVAQKVQACLQPTWEETHRVMRPWGRVVGGEGEGEEDGEGMGGVGWGGSLGRWRMMTASTRLESARRRRSLVVEWSEEVWAEWRVEVRGAVWERRRGRRRRGEGGGGGEVGEESGVEGGRGGRWVGGGRAGECGSVVEQRLLQQQCPLRVDVVLVQQRGQCGSVKQRQRVQHSVSSASTASRHGGWRRRLHGGLHAVCEHREGD